MGTDEVEITYLAGEEHLECELRKERGLEPIRIRNLHKVVGEMGKADIRDILITDAEENYRIFRITGTDGGVRITMELQRWSSGEGEWWYTIGDGNRLKNGRLIKEAVTIPNIKKIFEDWWWNNEITPF